MVSSTGSPCSTESIAATHRARRREVLLVPLLIATSPAWATGDQKMRNMDIQKLKEIIQVPCSMGTCCHGMGVVR